MEREYQKNGTLRLTLDRYIKYIMVLPALLFAAWFTGLFLWSQEAVEQTEMQRHLAQAKP